MRAIASAKTHPRWPFFLGAVMVAATLTVFPAGAQTQQTPEYIRGYAEGLVQFYFGLPDATVAFENQILTVTTKPISTDLRERIKTVLKGLNGVSGVEIKITSARPDQPVRALKAGPDKNAPPLGESLFAPLIADPRWPHFSAAFHHYSRNGNTEISDENLGNVGATSFGGTVPLFRIGPYMQFGVHASVYSIFNLDAASGDLVNADYWVAGALEYQNPALFSALLRLYHQSSHLGDEFLINNPEFLRKRVNLSYEALNLVVSQEWKTPDLRLRLYGGGEYILHKDPAELKSWTVHYGTEVYCIAPICDGALQPVAGVDVKNVQETDWNFNVSLRVGVEVKSYSLGKRRLLIMLEYFTGRSPNGQFYERTIEYWGGGVHLYF